MYFNMDIPFYKINKKCKKKKTISKYKITFVFQELIDSLLNNDTKPALSWSCELICSDLIDNLWKFIFDFYIMYVNVYYPNIIIYIYSKYKKYEKMKKNIKRKEIKNNISIREIFFRIIYIYSKVTKKFIIKLIKTDNLFKSFEKMNDFHERLNENDDVLLNNINTNNANEIIKVINNNSKSEIDYAVQQLKKFFNEFILCYDDKNNKRKYIIYYWLSYLLEKGQIRFNLYQNNDEDIHLKHCNDNNKYSYFIWIIWNIILEHHKTLNINKEINILYNIYLNYDNNQSTNAYLIIILSYILCLEKIKQKKSNIDKKDYNKCKLYYYKQFGFIEKM